MQLELFNILVWIWIAVAMITAIVLLKVTAPYGRHTKTTWGPMINNKFGWFIMELPSLLLFIFFVWMGRGIHMDISGFICLLYILHYTYRALLFPLLIDTGVKKMPLIIALSAIFFNLINGSINGYWLGSLASPFSASWLYDFRFVIGLILFIGGFGIHIYHDAILIRLRKNNSNEYLIPQGGLFKYITCPNYFGEIIEWLGFALMCWSLASFSFLIWTCANLIPRAIKHHQWYLAQFKNYPKNRKSLIPGVV